MHPGSRAPGILERFGAHVQLLFLSVFIPRLGRFRLHPCRLQPVAGSVYIQTVFRTNFKPVDKVQ